MLWKSIRIIVATGLIFMPAMGQAGVPVVELETPSQGALQGKVLTHNDEICWLADRAGEYFPIAVAEITAFHKVGVTFRPLSTSDMRSRLRQELGRKYDITIRGKYVVAAPRGLAERYADLFEEVSNSFFAYFSRRGMNLMELEFPLAVIVFPDQAALDAHLDTANLPKSPLLKGFYNPHSNRVVVCHSPDSDTDAKHSIAEEVQQTCRHEAIHQLAFNSGLHSRIGATPKWVVEGLATVLETGGIDDSRRSRERLPINRTRLDWYREHIFPLDQVHIADFIAADDGLFAASPLDAYSMAWALSYYLAEERSGDYYRYLRKLAARDPLAGDLSAAERLEIFQSEFDGDLSWMDTRVHRFIDSLPE